MDEKRYELVEIQVDAELLGQLEKIIAPMGLTPEMLAVKFFEFCVDPATQELMLSRETFCEALRKIQAQ